MKQSITMIAIQHIAEVLLKEFEKKNKKCLEKMDLKQW
jgi:hypothetical protein